MRYLLISQDVPSVVNSEARPVAAVRADRGFKNVELLETLNLSTRGVKGQKLVQLRMIRTV